MILALIGFGFILFGIIQFIRGCFKLLKAFFIRYLANEKQIDKAYENEVLKKSVEYKNFKRGVDQEIKNLLK
ncbi:MAG: hypothetical protein CMH22_01010 [Methylophaga sp.]|mgnify:FL=1|nr:hypothetical protein [Methylophaga sp.]